CPGLAGEDLNSKPVLEAPLVGPDLPHRSGGVTLDQGVGGLPLKPGRLVGRGNYMDGGKGGQVPPPKPPRSATREPRFLNNSLGPLINPACARRRRSLGRADNGPTCLPNVT